MSQPAAILPVAFVVALWFGSYSPEQISSVDQVPPFLQGSTDFGGSDLFAATIAMYVAFGLLGAFRAILRLHAQQQRESFWRALWSNLADLKWHAAVFVLGGTWNWSYDELIEPNDFRNMFWFAALIYSASAVVVTAVGRLPAPLVVRLCLAPLAIYAWLWLGWDGNTAKSGQALLSGADPAYRPRNEKHRVMLQWHQTLDGWLGDH